MLSCSIWFSAPSFWMGGGLESRCVGRVHGTDGAVHHPNRTHDLPAARVKHDNETSSFKRKRRLEEFQRSAE